MLKIELTEHKDGFWLWDETRKMNIAMKCKTASDALLEALEYYQERLLLVESEYSELKGHVNSFLSKFSEEEEEDY